MNIQITCYDDKATLHLKGRFQFDAHRAFRDAYTPLIGDARLRVVVLDMTGVEYLDSSALGMLLLLRERLGEQHQEIELAGLHGTVKQVLDVANFGRLFKIS